MKAVLSAICVCLLLSATSMAQPAVEFIKNEGQWTGDFQYKAITDKGDIYFAPAFFTYVFGASGNAMLMDDYEHGRLSHRPILNFQAVKMRFEGANNSQIVSEKPQQHYYNYFIGNDPAKWKSNIHPGLALNYPGIYNGIDMHVASASGNPKYEFMVKPGSDPAQIRLSFEGTDGLKIQNGSLVLKTSIGDIEEMKPVAYQYIDGERKEVFCRYRLTGNTVTYDLPDDYDHTALLIIDPIVVFSTFTGSTADNWGWTATYDPQGNFYAGGLVHSLGYPTTTGAFQVTFGGGVESGSLADSTHGNDYASDIGITKFNPSGTALIYSTYIGGNDNETPHSLIVDAGGNLVIAGKTFSANYPVTVGAFQGTYAGASDIVLTKLNPAGTALVGSTFLGGSVDDGINFNALEPVAGHLKHNYGDDARTEVLTDDSGYVYLAASTRSSNFPVTASAYQASLGGEQDAIFVKMNPNLSAMVYGTYVGGSNDDAGYVLALDTLQTHVYLGGGTMSTDFPTTGGTLNPAYLGGSSDGYIIKFQNSGVYPLQKICFIGTANRDQVFGIQTDLQNGVYAMGQSLGGSFPVTAGVYSNPSSCQFIIKLDPDLTTNVYSTVFGSGDPTKVNISPVAFLVDTCQNVYVSGWGGDLNFPAFTAASVGTTVGMPITADAFQSTTDGFDFYFIVLSKDALSLLYGTFYGRFSTAAGLGEHVDGGTSRFDKNGTIYQAICANCGGPGTPAFPTTSGVWAPTVGSSNCNLAALKINFQLSPPEALPSPDTSGCAPLTVQFHNNTTNAITYLWTFGDGTPDDTSAAPIHTFTNAGTYTIRLVAYNPVTCRITDTAFITVVADTNGVNASFTMQVVDSCGPFTATFANTSTYSSTPGSSTFTTFHWDFGDGTTYDGPNPPPHNFPDTNTYTITLIMTDTTACNSPDTATGVVTFTSNMVNVSFVLADSACLGSPTSFTGISNNAASYFWDFGDGQTSTDQSPVHTYMTAGTFHVTFIGINTGACNQVDSMEGDVTVYPLPVADFSFVPLVPTVNIPSTFTNLSTGAVSYIWSFGDGNSSIEVNPVHQYIMTGTYHVCLEARNQYGCKDTVCKDVPADVIPLADLPTAFSPNDDGSNEILFVRGGAIQTMDLKIYNRWGELVFESIEPEHGWDGTYKGKPQEMDAYGFVLNVTFIDGTTFMKKGNVTLLR